MRRALALTAVTAVAAMTATLTLTADQDPAFFPVGPLGAGPAAAGSLFATYDSCDALAADLADRAALTGGFGEVMGNPTEMMMDDEMAVEAMQSSDTSTGAAADRAAPATTAGGSTDTNVAVAGIDEPDLVETDGRRLFSVVDGQGLLVADVTTDTPTVLARVPLDDLGWSQLLLSGDRLLIIGQVWDQTFGVADGGPAMDMIMPTSGTTRLAVFDVSGEVPSRIATTDVEGQLVTARGVGNTVHVVSQSWPQPLAPEAVDAAYRTGDPQAALAAQLAQVPGEDFLPQVASDGGTTRMACDAVSFVPATRDAGLLSIHTFDLGRGDLAPVGASAIVSDGQNVTATADRLVVATTSWPDNGFGVPMPLVDGPAPDDVVGSDDVEASVPPQQGPSTLLHLFQIDAGGAAHLASGQVPGFLVNQFAMSWFDDHLRVATTIEDWNTGASVSQLAVLRPQDQDLVQVGVVGDLGVTEVIRSVRYLGDMAYVVTFRQTDPLYAIDLRNPANPVVTGELKITGFSSYLHPLGDGLLLGIGQEATEEGFVTGLQVQVFDVTNPAAPIRTSQIVLEGANSQAEFDHLAVTVHEGRLFLPYERYGFVEPFIGEDIEPLPQPVEPLPEDQGSEFVVEDGELIPVAPPAADEPVLIDPPAIDEPFHPQDVDLGVIVVDVTGDQLTEVARLRMDTAGGDPYGAQVQRVVVVDGNAVLVGGQQIEVYDPTLRRLGTIR